MINENRERIEKSLQVIYKERWREALRIVLELISKRDFKSPPSELFSEKDALLITYADSIWREGEPPLRTLRRFCEERLSRAFSSIHILPFFPYSSDDGFSVTDYYSVRPDLGDWSDLEEFARSFRLMYDFVLNHISSKSQWFHNYLEEREEFSDLAIEVDPQLDLSQVVRPRSTPLLTAFRKKSGKTVHVWTTFSEDQIDLNYRSLKTFKRMLELFLFYLGKGASLVRLDAIAYLWKEIGTSCIHLPETHAMVKLLRAICDCLAPQTLIVTETNVPHKENISYFGDGNDEAHVVYNFTLPPLLLYSFLQADGERFSRWAETLSTPTEETTFLNFTASHDGIGVRPLEDTAPEAIPLLVSVSKKAGGLVSYKKNPDGTESPYELNVTYVDAVLTACRTSDPRAFVASQAVAMALPGIPAIYILSLLGSRNWAEGVRLTGQARSINREKHNLDRIEKELEDPSCFRGYVFRELLKLLELRSSQPAFHPNSLFRVVRLAKKALCFYREWGGQKLYIAVNLSSKPLTLSITEEKVPGKVVDLVNGEALRKESFQLKPFGVRWITW